MATDPEGVIYLEVDEDITSAIDKLTKATGSTVQVVTAKRSTLFQSVINLKLLQKAAKDAKKSLVLVTSDRVATSLAGRLKVPVATQVGETPQVPLAAAAVVAGAGAALANDDEIDGGSVGDQPAPAVATPLTEAVPEAKPEPPAAAEPPKSPVAPPKAAKPKSQRIPNIGKMQKRIIWIALAIGVVIALFALDYFLTSANVALYANASQVNSTFDFTADPTASQSSTSSAVLSAEQLSYSKTLTAPAQATGTKDEGSEASGTITISNAYDSNPHPLVAGTRFVASGGQVFLLNADTTVPGGSLSGGHVVPGTVQVAVTASQNGDQYNLGPTSYTIPGLPADQQATITGQGNQMQGGITKTAMVLQQSDVTSAEQSALAADKAGGTQSVEGKANKDQTVLGPSLIQTAGSVSASPAVGSATSNATVSIPVTYTVLVVQKSELSALATSQESQQLGSQSQIYDDGSGNLQLTALGAPQASGAQKFKAVATAYTGTKIDTGALAKNLKGQKYGDAVQTASQVPGVTKATISLSPSWSTSLPNITSHIHVTIKVSNPGG